MNSFDVFVIKGFTLVKIENSDILAVWGSVCLKENCRYSKFWAECRYIFQNKFVFKGVRYENRTFLIVKGLALCLIYYTEPIYLLYTVCAFDFKSCTSNSCIFNVSSKFFQCTKRQKKI